MSALRWIVTLPWRTLRFPFRAYRRRISVQLIVSHVMVVMLSILLLEAAVIGIAVAIFQHLEDDAFTEFSIAEYATAAAIVMSADPTLARLGEPDEALTTAERARMNAALTALASQTSSEQFTINFGVETEPPVVELGLIDKAFVVDLDGVVVASSDPAWLAPGAPVETAPFPLTSEVTQLTLARDGAPSANGQRYVIDAIERITVVGHPLIVDDEVIGVLTLQSDRIEIPAFAEFAAGVAVANAFILAAIGLPALIVAIPVSVWRAWRLSGRLAELSAAATAMGAGDLSRRVRVRGQDEVARVSLRFNDMVERLESTDRARRSFVANVSHELRTPVAIIQGNLERMLTEQEGAATDEERRRLELLHGETLTLARLIDDLFTLARIEERALPLEAAPVRLDEVAGEVVEGIRSVAWGQRKVSIESLVRPDLPPVIADRTRLRQILGNLLYNALRHTPEGGLIVVNAATDGDVMTVSISDTGVGISAEELERVFDRFYQVERAGRHGEGSGLGLAIVKQLVEAQGGAVSVESLAGQGTTFRFTLPLAGSG